MEGGVHGRGHAWQGACMQGGMHGRGHAWWGGGTGGMRGGGHVWQEKRQLQWAVCILLECILIYILLELRVNCP